MFSVLMSVYAKENPQYLDEALRSIVSQTMQSDDIVIIMDGELTDDLYGIINRYSNDYNAVHPYQLEQNVQLGRALRYGVTKCKNNLVARMDSDDISLPDRFEKQYNYMIEHDDVSVLGGTIAEFDEDGHFVYKKSPLGAENICRYGKFRNPVNHVTVMFRKEDVIKAGNYRHLPYMEDYELWCRMLAGGFSFVNTDDVFVNVRTYKDMYKRRGGSVYIKSMFALRREQFKLKQLNVLQYIKAVSMSLAMMLIPNGIRRYIYRNILRSGRK